MDILMFETCWANISQIKTISDIKLVFNSSNITMMHGPINIQLIYCHFFNYNQQDATIFDYLFLKGSTCFGRCFRPSSGAQICTFSFRYCQPILRQFHTIHDASLQQYCLTIPGAECTDLCSWWWAEAPPETCTAFLLLIDQLNRLTPNDPYMGRTAPLTSKRCILYIYSTNIGTEYFKHALYSPFCSLQNAVCFIMLTCFVPVLFTFYIQVC